MISHGLEYDIVIEKYVCFKCTQNSWLSIGNGKTHVNYLSLIGQACHVFHFVFMASIFRYFSYSSSFHFFNSINDKQTNKQKTQWIWKRIKRPIAVRMDTRVLSYDYGLKKIKAVCLCIVWKMKTMSANSFCSKSVKCFSFNVTCHTLWFMNYECGQCIEYCLKM